LSSSDGGYGVPLLPLPPAVVSTSTTTDETVEEGEPMTPSTIPLIVSDDFNTDNTIHTNPNNPNNNNDATPMDTSNITTSSSSTINGQQMGSYATPPQPHGGSSGNGVGWSGPSTTRHSRRHDDTAIDPYPNPYQYHSNGPGHHSSNDGMMNHDRTLMPPPSTDLKRSNKAAATTTTGSGKGSKTGTPTKLTLQHPYGYKKRPLPSQPLTTIDAVMSYLASLPPPEPSYPVPLPSLSLSFEPTYVNSKQLSFFIITIICQSIFPSIRLVL
jgi:hypothetical protein